MNNTKSNLILNSKKLFVQNGYEQTTVEQIVIKTGIAKGTFYHHFNHKEDILFLILDEEFERLILDSKKILKDNNKTADIKLKQILQSIFSVYSSINNVEAYFANIKTTIYNEHISKLRSSKITPIILNAVKQGIDESVFHLRFPDIIVPIIVNGITSLFDNIDYTDTSNDYVTKSFKAIEELLTKVLECSIRIFEDNPYET